MSLRAGEVWELVPPNGYRTSLFVIVCEEPNPIADYMPCFRMMDLETGRMIHRATWLFEEGYDFLKSSPATQQWRRVA